MILQHCYRHTNARTQEHKKTFCWQPKFPYLKLPSVLSLHIHILLFTCRAILVTVLLLVWLCLLSCMFVYLSVFNWCLCMCLCLCVYIMLALHVESACRSASPIVLMLLLLHVCIIVYGWLCVILHTFLNTDLTFSKLFTQSAPQKLVWTKLWITFHCFDTQWPYLSFKFMNFCHVNMCNTLFCTCLHALVKLLNFTSEHNTTLLVIRLQFAILCYIYIWKENNNCINS